MDEHVYQKEVVLIARSSSAQLALRLAARYPQKVSFIVLNAPEASREFVMTLPDEIKKKPTFLAWCRNDHVVPFKTYQEAFKNVMVFTRLKLWDYVTSDPQLKHLNHEPENHHVKEWQLESAHFMTEHPVIGAPEEE